MKYFFHKSSIKIIYKVTIGWGWQRGEILTPLKWIIIDKSQIHKELPLAEIFEARLQYWVKIINDLLLKKSHH